MNDVGGRRRPPRPPADALTGALAAAAFTALIGVLVLLVMADASVTVAVLIATVVALCACLIVVAVGDPVAIWPLLIGVAVGWLPLLIAASLTNT